MDRQTDGQNSYINIACQQYCADSTFLSLVSTVLLTSDKKEIYIILLSNADTIFCELNFLITI